MKGKKSSGSFLEESRDAFKVEISSEKLGNISADLYDQLKIDMNGDLKNELSRQAPLVAYWGMLMQVAEEELRAVDMEYDLWYSEVYREAERRLWGEHDFKVSYKPNITSVENEIKSKHKVKWILWSKKRNRLETNVMFLLKVKNWFNDRTQMLIQISKQRAAEMESIEFELRKHRLEAMQKREGSIDG